MLNKLPNKSILYVPIFGGLGNQMFQLANAIEISKKANYKLKLVNFTSTIGSIKRNWNLNCFGFEPSDISNLKKNYIRSLIKLSNIAFRLNLGKSFGVLNENHIVKQKNYDIYNKKICMGYWQSENYFSNSVELIKKQFAFDKKLTLPSYLRKNLRENTVAIHVRRGDYIANPSTKLEHLICTEDWYMKAFRKINKLVANPKFYVFSDDIEYTKVLFKDFLKYDIFFVPKDNRDWFHMFVMSYCKNFIISNSSYSWWASFLSKEANNKIICPKYWQRNKLTKSIGIYRKDFLLM